MKIQAIVGQVGSGGVNLHFEDGSSVIVSSGQGMRSLLDCFDVNSSSDLIGQEIQYEADEFGFMICFAPMEEG